MVLCMSDSEITVKNVFVKRRHLFVPFLRFNLLRFYPLLHLMGQSAPLNFIFSCSCSEEVDISEDEHQLSSFIVEK